MSTADESIDITDVHNTSSRRYENLAPPVTKAEFYSSVPLLEPSHRIRLLSLDACDASGRAPLKGQLRTVDVDNIPPFSALSYVWGEKTSPAHFIHCQPGGFALEISEPCYSALWQIRRRFAPLNVWVDVICINQEDDEEKGDQIPHMKMIFTLAESVYVWLGHGNENTDLAVKYLRGRAKLNKPCPVRNPFIGKRNVAAKSKGQFLSFKDWIIAVICKSRIFPSRYQGLRCSRTH